MPPLKLRCQRTLWRWKFGSKIFDFEPQISSQPDKLHNHNGTKKTREVGQSFWDGGSSMLIWLNMVVSKIWFVKEHTLKACMDWKNHNVQKTLQFWVAYTYTISFNYLAWKMVSVGC